MEMPPPLEDVAQTQDSLGRAIHVRPFFARSEMDAARNNSDAAERIGRRIADVFIVLLGLLFAYGFVWPLIAG